MIRRTRSNACAALESKARRYTVLILTAGTGSGHDSVAEAVAQALSAGDSSAPRLVIAAPLGDAIDGCYGWALNRAPSLWGACYYATNYGAAIALAGNLLGAARGARLAALLADERPDLILSVHALCAQLVSRTLRCLGLAIPHHCVVTDMVDVHRSWIAPGVDTYYVATARAGLTLQRAGVTPTRIMVTGLPLRRAFCAGTTSMPAHHEWALPRDGTNASTPATPDRSWAQSAGVVVPRRTRLRVLLMDGGQPGPGLTRALAALLGAGPPLDLLVAWGRTSPPDPLPRVESSGCTLRHLAPGAAIDRHMRAADVVVTKAGSVTIAETLALGRPVLIHRAAPGQEAGNPLLLEAAGAGLHTPTPNRLADAMRYLAVTPTARRGMAMRAAALGRPGAAHLLAAHVLATLERGGGTPGAAEIAHHGIAPLERVPTATVARRRTRFG